MRVYLHNSLIPGPLHSCFGTGQQDLTVAVSFGKVRNLGSLLPHVFRSRINLIDARGSKSQKNSFFRLRKVRPKSSVITNNSKAILIFCTKKVNSGLFEGDDITKKIVLRQIEFDSVLVSRCKKNSKPSTLRKFFYYASKH